MAKTIKETADALGIKERTVREWIKLGKILAHKHPHNAMIYIADSEIERKLQEKEEFERMIGIEQNSCD